MIRLHENHMTLVSLIIWVVITTVIDSLPIYVTRREAFGVQQGLDYVRAIGIPYLCKAIGEINVPDVTAIADSPIGKFGYTISNVSLYEVAIPKSNLTVSQTKGLTITATNATLSIRANWKYKQLGWPRISDSGSCDLAMKQIIIGITLNVDTKDESIPKLTTNDATLKIGKMKIRFHGGASWLYNIFADAITNDVKGTFEKVVVNEMVALINKQGNKYLAKFPGVIAAIKTHLKEENREEIEDQQS